jgi:hypothetical protein
MLGCFFQNSEKAIGSNLPPFRSTTAIRDVAQSGVSQNARNSRLRGLGDRGALPVMRGASHPSIREHRKEAGIEHLVDREGRSAGSSDLYGEPAQPSGI